MSLWRQLSRGLSGLLHPGRAAQDADDEVRHYLEQATAEHLARGSSPEAARRAARLEVGSLAAATEELRSYGWERAVEAVATDLRHAVRRLRMEPGFTTVTVLTLALGIGASTAIMSAVGPILFQPLPYPDPNRILAVWDIGTDGVLIEPTFNTHRELRARTTAFETLAVFRPWQPTLTGAHEPERLEAQQVSWEFLRVLGALPALGRDFEAADDRAGAAGAVVLSDELWRRRFGTDPAIIGRPVTLSDESYVVVGVMPRQFENVLGPAAELWTPLRFEPGEGRAWGHHLRMIGRLRPGESLDGAARDLATIADNPVPDFPRVAWAALDRGLSVTSLHADLTRGAKPALLALLGAATLLLVIACVNVTNLLLARSVRRRGEFALRATLGAGAGRLVRQAVTESLLLAALGGAAGIALAGLGVRALIALSPPELPRLGAVGIDGSVLAFAVGLTLLVGLALGVVPARAAVRADGQGPRPMARHVVPGAGRARAVLIVTQVALALVLLVSAGLLLRSMQRVLEMEPGFDPDRRLAMQIRASGLRYADAGSARRYFGDVLDAVRNVPGVAAAALTSQLPLSGDLDLYGARLEPPVRDDQGEAGGTFRYAVSPGYFETMGIPLRQGRLLHAGDRADAVPVAVVSESFARRRLPGVDPLGRQVRIGDSDPFTIVGVVGDVRQVSLALSQSDAVYLPLEQGGTRSDLVLSLVVRTEGAPAALTGRIRQAVWSVDKDQPVVRVATMDDLLSASGAERRFTLIVFQAFALAALALAAAGLYGVLSGSVTARTREIGVRAALGASPRGILTMVVRQGMALTAIGIAVGLACAALTTRALAAMLFGTSPLDPTTFLMVVILLVVVALLACVAPAWRAVRVNPASPLRAE
ncbi:MAG: ADOP family duplicated permease [Gemmatimonadales bacterium]